jgi:phosphohistidine phosphatase SixA
MIVTIWRHGEAANTVPDENRRLTPRGQDELATAGSRFATYLEENQLPAPQEILHSPLVRTTETAARLGGILHVAPAVHQGLAPEASRVEELCRWLNQREVEHLLLVGHQPSVSSLIWYLLDDQGLPALLPGGYATMELPCFERGAGVLLIGCPNPLQVTTC